MLKTSLRTFVLALAFAVSASFAASAEMVYHRGNAADPETLDQH